MGKVRALYRATVTDSTICTKGSVQHVLVPLSLFTERALKTICEEGFTAAMYLQFLLKSDIEAREGTGWTVEHGWPLELRHFIRRRR